MSHATVDRRLLMETKLMLQEFDLVHDAVKERLTRLERHLPCDQLCRVFTNIHYPMTRLQRAISFQILCNRDTEWAAFLPLQAESKELAKAVDRFRIRLESRIKWLCRWQSAIRLQVKINRHGRVQTKLAMAIKSFCIRLESRIKWLCRWQSAIRTQVKINRHDRVQTALNRVASRKRELIKNRRKAAKEAKKAAGGGSTFSPPGKSGPAKKTAWAVEAASPSSRAKREGKKKTSQEACFALAEKKRQEQEVQAATLAEQLYYLGVADAINDEE